MYILSILIYEFYNELNALLNYFWILFSISESNNQKVWDPVLLCLISSNVVFVIVIVTLLVVQCKRWGNRHRGKISHFPSVKQSLFE